MLLPTTLGHRHSLPYICTGQVHTYRTYFRFRRWEISSLDANHVRILFKLPCHIDPGAPLFKFKLVLQSCLMTPSWIKTNPCCRKMSEGQWPTSFSTSKVRVSLSLCGFKPSNILTTTRLSKYQRPDDDQLFRWFSIFDAGHTLLFRQCRRPARRTLAFAETTEKEVRPFGRNTLDPILFLLSSLDAEVQRAAGATLDNLATNSGFKSCLLALSDR